MSSKKRALEDDESVAHQGGSAHHGEDGLLQQDFASPAKVARMSAEGAASPAAAAQNAAMA